MDGRSRNALRGSARFAVVGGGPAGSFFSYFSLRMAERAGLELEVDLFEPRDFRRRGPKGCNMCGGIVSESLIQRMAAEGLNLPPRVIQRRIDSYFLHMDVGSVRIPTPLQEMRIAAVARGSGPRVGPEPVEGLDAFLLELAVQQGARHVAERVTGLTMEEGRPTVETPLGRRTGYDLVVLAVGVNSALLRELELGELRPPRSTKAYIAELHLGREAIDRHLGSSMHVFLLNLPRLDFAALIPKGEYTTFCLLGEEIGGDLVDEVLGSREVREVLPPGWEPPNDYCHCSPLLNIGSTARPYGDRVVLIGDSGATRLFKDGIGAAYRTAKAAARTAVFRGVGAVDFRRGYAPVCRSIESDNNLGRWVFRATKLVQRTRGARRALWRTTSGEQQLQGAKRRMSRILWNTFTGSAPYRSVLAEGMHPMVWSRLAWEYVGGLRYGDGLTPSGRVPLASGKTGVEARHVAAGEVVFEPGDVGTCLFLVGDGRVRLTAADLGPSDPGTVLGPGDFFGEMALFGEGTRTGTARALEDTSLYALERHDLLLRIHEESSMAFRLIEAMARRAQRAEELRFDRGEAGVPGTEPTEDGEPGATAELPEAITGRSGLLGRPYEPGEAIYHQGDRGDRMYAILGGRVELVRRSGTEEGRLAVLGVGDFFGEAALFHTQVRPTSARALDRVHVLTLERAGLLRSIEEDPSVAMSLSENLARRTERANAGNPVSS